MFLLFLCLSVLLVWQMRAMDRTNLATTNGLWKSGPVHKWEVTHKGEIDSGGHMYYPMMGKLCEYTPDAWWRYSVDIPRTTFREMAAWNGIFGAFATALVFGLVWRITADAGVAFLTAFFHATAAFVVLHTLNSEDIMPGYSMFLLALYGFFRAASGDSPLFWIAASSIGLGAATLLHWTLTPPAIAGLGLAHLVFLLGNPGERWRVSVGAVTGYLLVLKAWTLLYPASSNIGVWTILYPAKASASGWVGFLPSKFYLLLVAIPNYFTGGYNMGTYEGVWSESTYGLSLLIGMAWFAVCLAGFAYLITRPGLPRLLALCAAGVFAVGQAENVYSQPQDPQMQIQPMFLGVAGFLGVLLFLKNRFSRRRFLAVAFGLVAPLVAANYGYTLWLMSLSGPADDEFVRIEEDFRRRLPASSAFLVLVGFESLVTWETALYYGGDVSQFMQERGVISTTPFTWAPRADAPRVARYMLDSMEAARKKGMNLYANIVWNETRQSFQNRFLTVASPEESGRLYDIMVKLYKPLERISTEHGEFVEIVPAAP